MRYLVLILCASITLSCAPGNGDHHTSDDAPDESDVRIVLMVCLDAFRYDHLRPDLTPNLTTLAADSMNYTNCHSSAPWTLPSTASTFTGKHPSYASVLQRGHILPDEELTLAEIFSDEGWDTIGISANSIIGDIWNIDQGFNWFSLLRYKQADILIDTVIEKIEEDPENKKFIYVHLMDTHMPYEAPESFIETWGRGDRPSRSETRSQMVKINKGGDITDATAEHLRGKYDAACAYADDEIGRLINTLKEMEVWDETAFVFFADHGEEHDDHDRWFHGQSMYEELVHVPLIAKFPGVSPDSSDQAVPLKMIGGLILDSAGIERPSGFIDDGVCYMEGLRAPEEIKSIISDDGMKLIVNMVTENRELFDLNEDPIEQNNLYESDNDVVLELLTMIAEIIEAHPDLVDDSQDISPQMAEELRALGYI